MRIGLLGDIHGDLRALESTLRHLDSHGVDQLLCTGDLIGYGWQADEVAALVRSLAIPCVRGNHDRWALEDRRVLGARGWKPAQLADETWELLGSLPTSIRWRAAGALIEVHHGSPASDTEFVNPYRPLPSSVHQFWERADASVLVVGHTHTTMIDRSCRGLILNPGSIVGVSGVATSYTFAVLEMPSTAVRLYDVRTGREIRRDPVFLNNSDEDVDDND